MTMTTPDRNNDPWRDIVNEIATGADALPSKLPKGSLLNLIVPKPQGRSAFKIPFLHRSRQVREPQADLHEEIVAAYQGLRYILTPVEAYYRDSAREMAESWKTKDVKRSPLGTTYNFRMVNPATGEQTDASITTNARYFLEMRKITVGDRFIQFDDNGRVIAFGAGNNSGRNDLVIRAEEKNAGAYIRLAFGRQDHYRAQTPDLDSLAIKLLDRTTPYTAPGLELEREKSAIGFEVFVQDPEDHSYIGYKRV